ncbi:hypothetical protein SNE40_004461 [Patella caerulea]|uniref:Tetratricopeptide repeat protein 37 n=1 Tax=Patella caerulea TaxID=87958 RepID=A0AAN8K2X8_PATCE
MDNKEIKAALKNAREAISNKEYDTALQHCQNVLDADEKNYNALVFTGLAADKLDKTDQAMKAYIKATELNPDQILGWQGLCGFYEKNQAYVSVYKKNLVPVYEKMIVLYKCDVTKRIETMKRLAGILNELGLTDKCIKVYQDLLLETEDEKNKLEIKKTMIKHLESQDVIQTKLLFDCYDSCLDGGQLTSDEKEAMLTGYVSVIVDKMPQDVIEVEINKLSQLNPSSAVLLEYQILMMLEKNIENQVIDDNSLLREKMNSLEAVVNENNAMLKMVQAYFLLVEKKYDLAKDNLLQAKGLYPNYAVVYCLLAVVYLHLGNNQSCIKCVVDCQQVLKSVKKKSLCIADKTLIKKYLNLLQSRALCNIGTTTSLQQASDILQQGEVKGESEVLLCKIYMKQGQTEKAMELIKQLECEDHVKEHYLAWYDFSKKKYELALSRLEKLCCSADNGGSDAWCLMAKALWQMLQMEPDNKEREQKCYTTLFTAAQKDPNNCEPFLYLGHFYFTIRKDNRLAKKCYEKAYHLDSALEEAGAALCDIMTSIGEQDAAYNLLLKVTNEASAGSAKWAWLRLGLCQIKLDNAVAAISSFQSALRADTTDNHVWECLAEAYFHRGSFTAALKAFTKASELCPESLYCKYQIATITQKLGIYDEAISTYKDILDISPNYVPALKGLGETNLLMARNNLNQNLDGRVKDNCEEALVFLTKAASERSDMSCLWKLLGDACILVLPLASDNCILSVPKKLLEKCDKNSDELVKIQKREVIQLSTRCYGRALKSLPENSMLWHDLSIAYFHLSELVQESERKSIIEKSVQFIKKAISLDSANYLHWNALGVFSASKEVNNPELAQHCFIKSINTETNNVVAWTNLGTLYLIHDNVNLAHEAFKVAQSLDPNYVACWIGQAIIAETVGHEDTMDLYRHTTELSYHPEGSVGYAHWVCSMLQDHSKHHTDMFQYSIKQMAAIPSATDTLTRYLERCSDDTTALNMYGLLLEQQTFYSSASTALERCVKLLEAQTVPDITRLNKARLNWARVLCKQNLYEKSIEIYKQTTSIEQAEDICYYGYTLYKAGNLAESFKAYEKAAEIVETDDDRSHVYAALGMVSYKFGDLDGAKTALFTGSQISPPSIIGLKALCGLGLLQSDVTLVTAVLQELVQQEDNQHSDTMWFTVALDLVQGNYIQPMRYLQRTIHTNPRLYETWLALAELLVKYFPERGTASANCIRVGQYISQVNQKNALAKTPDLLTLAQLQSGQHSRKLIDRDTVKTAQQVLHNNPGNVRNWISFISCLHAEGLVRRCLKSDGDLHQVELTYLDHILQNNEEVRNNIKLKLWCYKQKVICLIETGQMEQAQLFLKQVDNEFGDPAFSSTILDMLNGSRQDKPEVVINEQESLYLCQILVESYIQNGLFIESVNLLKQYSSHLSDDEKKKRLMIAIQITHITYKLLLTKTEEDITIRQLFDDSITEVLELDPNNAIALLMKGAVLLGTSYKDPKRAQMLAKKPLLQSYNLSQFDTCFNIGTDIARKQLIQILQSSKKDDPLLEKLMKSAEDHIVSADEEK